MVANDYFQTDLIKYNVVIEEGVKEFLSALKGVVYDKVIKHPNVQQMEFKGQKMVVSVFETLKTEPENFLPRSVYEKFKHDEERALCDYVAGMTDEYLMSCNYAASFLTLSMLPFIRLV